MLNIEWLAGFIDGEGCFNICKNRTTLSPRLLIVNTNLEILQEIREKYGGDITSRNLGPENWKTFNCLRIAGKNFKSLVPQLIPYLKLKKIQALLCLDMIDNKDIEFRKQTQLKIKLLNKRGK